MIKNIVTIGNYNKLPKEYKEGKVSAIDTVAILTGNKPEDLRSLKQSELMKLEALVASQITGNHTAVSMVRYRGKNLGYYPCDIGTLDDMVGMAGFSNNKNYNALCALLFRESTGWSNWVNRKRWGKSHGLQAKPIVKFEKDFTKYKCKKLTDFDKIDLDFYDDFPIALLFSAINFSIGVGLNGILTRSTPITIQTQSRIQELISGMMLENISQRMGVSYWCSKELKKSGVSILGQLFDGSSIEALKLGVRVNSKILGTATTDIIRDALEVLNKITPDSLWNLNKLMLNEKDYRKLGLKRLIYG